MGKPKTIPPKIFLPENWIFPLKVKNRIVRIPTLKAQKKVTDENKPILRVFHDDDGDWQFLTGDQMPEDIKIVALEQLTIKDRTLNEVFDLEYGEEAERGNL